MNTKVYALLLAASFGLMILGSIIGGILESSGSLTRESLGPRGVALVVLAYCALLCCAAFSAVPLALRFFIAGQVKIGNGELFLIKWLQAHEHTVVYCVWGVFVLGLGIACALAKNEIMKMLP